jgi:hypothetical protein
VVGGASMASKSVGDGSAAARRRRLALPSGFADCSPEGDLRLRSNFLRTAAAIAFGSLMCFHSSVGPSFRGRCWEICQAIEVARAGVAVACPAFFCDLQETQRYAFSQRRADRSFINIG